uniref:Peptidase A1 domain-containing protein n=1 Tax=Heterorhabditis bacteriophora TaxID=37862 RepID=A0A1I7WG82_HETBA
MQFNILSTDFHLVQAADTSLLYANYSSRLKVTLGAKVAIPGIIPDWPARTRFAGDIRSPQLTSG